MSRPSTKLVRYLSTLAMLLGLGYVGHLTHWEWPHAAAKHGQKDVPHVAASPMPTPPAPRVAASESEAIVFDSGSAVAEAGIQLEQVGLVRIAKEVLASAEVEYDRRKTVELSSRVPGVIHKVLCQWGQYVEAGEILAIVEAGDVGRLKSEFAKAIFDRGLRHKTLDRYRAANDAIPLRQIREAEGALQAANVALLSAEQALVNLGFQLHWADYADLSETEVIQRLRHLGLASTASDDALSQLTSSNLLPIVAPIAGVVIGNDSAIGEAVGPDRPFMQVSDVSRLWVRLDIRKEDASLIRLGQAVSFLPDGVASPVQGKVSWISTEVDEKTRTLRVRAEIENPRLDGQNSPALDTYVLRANMFGTARVQISQQEVTAVSRDCLHMDEGRTVVFVQTSQNRFEPRAVEYGMAQAEKVQVIGDIAPGSVVASQGSQLLKSELVLSRMVASSRP